MPAKAFSIVLAALSSATNAHRAYIARFASNVSEVSSRSSFRLTRCDCIQETQSWNFIGDDVVQNFVKISARPWSPSRWMTGLHNVLWHSRLFEIAVASWSFTVMDRPTPRFNPRWSYSVIDQLSWNEGGLTIERLRTVSSSCQSRVPSSSTSLLRKVHNECFNSLSSLSSSRNSIRKHNCVS